MAKKQKNKKHTEAVRRKAVAAEQMAKLGLSLDGDSVSVGFVFSHLAVSHLTYLGIGSINNVCRNYAGIDVCIFTQHVIKPCLQLSCSVFPVADLLRWHAYPLISTTIGTTLDALASNAPMVYHYAFDPEFIDRQHVPSGDIRKAFCDPRVKVVTRHETHAELIEAEFGIKVCKTIVPDCDAEALARLVLTETKDNG